jgi:LuxR family maltose regulon positive regulatory protein
MFEQEEARAAGQAFSVDASFANRQAMQGKSGLMDGWRQGMARLSRQEMRVLRLLVAGHTYVEMAEILTVSPNTVKTQVSSIYRKLGVSRRAEAIAQAGRLTLL